MSARAVLSAAMVVGSLAVASSREAKAQTRAPSSPAEVALAQKLFDEARALFQRGDVREACERFASSQSLDPRGGTLLDLAICHERAGRTASAWSEFNRARVVAVNERRSDRASFAAEHIEQLAPRLAYVKIVVHNDERLPLTLSLDGAQLAAAALDQEIPLDPGPHDLVATAPAHKELHLRVTATERVHAVAEIGPFVVDPSAHVAPPAPPVAAAPVAREPAAPRAAASTGWSRRSTGYVVGGAGLAAIGVGAVFGVLAIENRHDARNECTSVPCGSAPRSLSDAGLRNAWVSDIGIGVGLAAVALGVVLVITGGASDAPARTAAGMMPLVEF